MKPDWQIKWMAEDAKKHLSGYTEEQLASFFAEESEYTDKEKRSYAKAVKAAEKHYADHAGVMVVGWEDPRPEWQYQRAVQLGMDSSIGVYNYSNLREGWHELQKPEARRVMEWQKELGPLVGVSFDRATGHHVETPPDATLHYVQTTSNMRQQLKDEQDDLRVKSYAMQVKQFFLRLDPRRAKMFVRELTGSEHGDWQKLFGYLDEIPDPPAKRLDPSYEKSKAYARTLRATRNYEKAIDAARKAYDRAKDWNEFLDKKAQETAPALPAPTPKALSLGAESMTPPASAPSS